MRNQEAARYARMAAMTAGAIVLIVAGIYVQRQVRNARARRGLSATVPSAVQQESANFTYSDVEQGRTVFTLRASHATQFKEGNRALLDDVWITVYGRQGDRNDNIHTRQCSYEPTTGSVRCQGEVQIDIQGAKDAPSAATPGAATLAQPLQIKTSDLTFNRETGEAATAAPVEFTFAQGKGHGTGIRYSTHDATLRIEHDVEFDLAASDRTGGVPVKATGSGMELQRDNYLALLDGPAVVQQADRALSAGKISIKLDHDYHAREALAEDHPTIQGKGNNGAKFSLSAGKFDVSLAPDGTIEKLESDGAVAALRQGPAGTDRFLADHVAIDMFRGENLAHEMLATGSVVGESQQGNDSRNLKTDALKVTFKAASQQQKKSRAGAPPAVGGGQRIESAETLAPATIDSKTGNESTQLKAKRFTAQFGTGGRLERLFGHDGVEVRRQIDGGAAQTSSAAEMAATFAADGDWDSIEETGKVEIADGDRRASAAKATMERATGIATLQGSPVISDSQSRTTAGAATINQQSGELHATGGIVSTYIAPASGKAASAMDFGAGAAHISADKLDGSTNAGHAIYSGHARMWQGESVLEAEQIEMWRDEKKLEAEGKVVAVFPQAAGSGPDFNMGNRASSRSSAKPAGSIPGRGSASGSAPGPAPAGSGGAKATLWQIRAPLLTYWSDEGKAHLQDGVTASSDQGLLQSRTLDVFLSPTAASQTTSGKPAASVGAAGRELARVFAQGDVIVRQGDRQGSAEQAEYTAADQKFVLSGGQPTIRDAASDTTTQGRSLTFFVASDTILIDSQEGLRTLTKHRVEK